MNRKVIFIVVILILSAFNSNATNSSSSSLSLASAKKLAIATNKLILVDFTASWCGPCKRMDRESWSNSEVKELMSNFIFLKIDIDNNKEISKKYGVRGIPYIFILDPNGETLYRGIGYKVKSELLTLLKNYSLNLEYVKQENIAFFEGKTSLNSIKLAEKYLDFTLFIEDEVLQAEFRSLASVYLSVAEELLKKDKKSKNVIKQRSKLLLIYSRLLKGKYEKSLKKLDANFDESKVLLENKSLYSFLYYVVYSKLLERDNARVWYNKLRETKGYKPYFQKSRKI